MTEEALASASYLIQQPLNWEYILEVSIKHGVSPLLYRGLSQVLQSESSLLPAASGSPVPRHVMEELQALYRNSLLRNQRLYGVIGELCKAFERAGVQAMGLKDVLLAIEVYPDMGLRPMGDIDILIHREDYSKVAACMAALGFTPLPGPDI